MKHDFDGESLLIGFFVGATLGGIAALLLAPSSGRRLRRDISREGRKLGNRVEETLDHLRDESVHAYERAREAIA